METLASVIAMLPLSHDDREIVKLSATLTLHPQRMNAEQLQGLRERGFTDEKIHAIVMVTACFAFMNRLADGTGVTLQKDRFDLATELFGAEALAAHLTWAEGR